MAFFASKTTFVLALAALVAAADEPVCAQSVAGAQQADEAASLGSNANVFSFPGGTLRDFVRKLEGLPNEQVKIVLDPEIEGVQLSPIEVRQPKSSSLLGYLEIVS